MKYKNIESLCESIQNYYKNLCDAIIGLERVVDLPDFENYPASTNWHHAYDYGLTIHTFEVVTTSMNVYRTAGANPFILFNAAIWHDYGKKWEYEFVDDKWVKKSTYTPQGHMHKSKIEFLNSMTSKNCSEEEIKAILHCIDSHHGRKEWNAIEEPKTKEALILHQMDLLSAGFGQSKKDYKWILDTSNT